MSKFTKEEVNLCKQVTERYKKSIKYGDWVYTHQKEIALVLSPIGKLDWGIKNYKVLPEEKGRGIYNVYENKNEYFPLWTISDCLEFLKSKGYYYAMYDQVGGGTVVDIFKLSEGNRSLQEQIHGETALESCLKAVIAVKEDKLIKAKQ